MWVSTRERPCEVEQAALAFLVLMEWLFWLQPLSLLTLLLMPQETRWPCLRSSFSCSLRSTLSAGKSPIQCPRVHNYEYEMHQIP